MLFYYSATGITRKLALTIAERTGDCVCSIENELEKGECSYSLKDSERLGFLSPVYFGAVPDIVKRFVEKIQLQTADNYYCFVAFTYGASAFNAANQLTGMLMRHGITTNAAFGACGIDTFLPMYTIPSGESRTSVEAQMSTQNALIAEQVADRTQINDVKTGPFPRLTSATAALLYAWMRRTNNFRVSDACTGCGLCAKNCPEHAISLDPDTHRPQWNAPKCMLCLRCLHHCPAAAIDYSDITKDKIRLRSYP
ncbi:MAG: EFR1 family ferrodoxin [Proteobacteria bacterium]|nr:EFR1 family ferrodoxin [Pseudomonadota bacterium]